jgi:hypothetical protein
MFSTVTESNAQGKTIYTGSETEIVGFKVGYDYGVEASLSINTSTDSSPGMPSPIWENPADKTSVKTIVPPLKIN